MLNRQMYIISSTEIEQSAYQVHHQVILAASGPYDSYDSCIISHAVNHFSMPVISPNGTGHDKW